MRRSTSHYQPVVDLRGRRSSGVEALLRWRRARRADLRPPSFIPLAERTGPDRADHRLGGGRGAAARRRTGAGAGSSSRSRSTSRPALWQPSWTRRLLDTLERYGIDPADLLIEVTETTAMSDPDRDRAGAWPMLHDAGRAAGDRRLRHGLLLALTAEADARVDAQDRPLVRQRPARRRGRRRDGAHDHPARAQPRPPAAGRGHRDTTPSAASWSSTAAPSARASTSAGRPPAQIERLWNQWRAQAA